MLGGLSAIQARSSVRTVEERTPFTRKRCVATESPANSPPRPGSVRSCRTSVLVRVTNCDRNSPLSRPAPV
eukprot:315228-Hanusia_phi.AAC.1